MERKLEIDGKPRNPYNLPFKKFRKKPIEIRAVRIFASFKVQTKEGIMEGKSGDWLIIGVEGEMYPCDHNIFLKSYDVPKGMKWIMGKPQ